MSMAGSGCLAGGLASGYYGFHVSFETLQILSNEATTFHTFICYPLTILLKSPSKHSDYISFSRSITCTADLSITPMLYDHLTELNK